MRYIMVISAIWLGLAAVLPARADELTTQTGYALNYDVYPANGPTALVFLHGKNGSHISPNMKLFAERIAQAGIAVYLPRMPWSRLWDGTVQDGLSGIDALVDLAARDGKKVFVGGQSLGANFATVYRPADPPPAVVGKVVLNPGAFLDLTPSSATSFWGAFMPSVERAWVLEKEGKGKEKTKFSGTNVVGDKSIDEHYETTPEVFLSFHDIKRYPSNRESLRATKWPVFWSSGKKDPIQTGKRQTFNLMPNNPASVYMDIDGDHNTAMMNAIDPAIAWMKKIAP